MENKNGGALFVAKKEKPTQPDFYGTGEFRGVQFKISGWTNLSRTGTRYQRLIFTEIVPFDTNEISSDLQVTAEKPAQEVTGEQQRLEMGTGVKDLDGNVDSVMLDDLPF